MWNTNRHTQQQPLSKADLRANTKANPYNLLKSLNQIGRS
ncbi:hypothetical protein D020_4116 [Vibrio parahaemolyticus SBR10290]|nr:hypothetical protein D052_5079 [Vibrio parahaemolyticus 10290]ESV66505.1 hypothetical protein D021_4345 [Vibrio parahaemolyticus 10296]ESW42209.1 hypothetical protein D022_4283 [Vibrio parahaemolyticus 12310]ETT17800.1 hypothetical protein D023_4302 [Vibrio parahaemolyticus 3256]ETX51262.1 hypothetical protein D020_4116 [Vibrio parahaemolyticus SBR10290]EVU12921.1 hypothetical protein D046_6269 [Vibrio parahaemolyticus V-223/04]